jgi:rhodanese-related sulfurtransferase
MLSFIKNLFKENITDYKSILQAGGVIVDVRTPEEFKSGHVKGALNIPLQIIPSKISQLKQYPHIIVCCRSGSRSGMAKTILQQKGINQVYNGGSWQNINKHV